MCVCVYVYGCVCGVCVYVSQYFLKLRNRANGCSGFLHADGERVNVLCGDDDGKHRSCRQQKKERRRMHNTSKSARYND